MTASIDTPSDVRAMPDMDQAAALRNTLTSATRVNHAGRIFFGSVLMISAFGLWLVPVTNGDAAMQLIKLLVSIVMLLLGGMFVFSARNTDELPEIQIDTTAREISIVKRDAEGRMASNQVHKIDDMADITLRDRMFTAHDASGAVVVSVPVPDKRMEKALKSALQLSV
ncbi:MAG: hypothetical protein AB8B82_02495 [Roseovarius sp.]